jgi:hypothetical protein
VSGAVPPAALGIDAATYRRWLDRKAIAHVRRDRARGRPCSAATYRKAIHDAVVASEGRDAYTGEVLDWTLISTYCNTQSALGRHAYKRTLALLPTVDHVEADAPTSAFRICAWRTNDAKNDLSVEAFVALCRRVVAHAENATAKPAS